MRKGSWDPVLVGVIVALILLGIVLFFWARESTGFLGFFQSLFGLEPPAP